VTEVDVVAAEARATNAASTDISHATVMGMATGHLVAAGVVAAVLVGARAGAAALAETAAAAVIVM